MAVKNLFEIRQVHLSSWWVRRGTTLYDVLPTQLKLFFLILVVLCLVHPQAAPQSVHFSAVSARQLSTDREVEGSNPPGRFSIIVNTRVCLFRSLKEGNLFDMM